MKQNKLHHITAKFSFKVLSRDNALQHQSDGKRLLGEET
jgi:hypothetical protein